jgi:hypothetical protein
MVITTNGLGSRRRCYQSYSGRAIDRVAAIGEADAMAEMDPLGGKPEAMTASRSAREWSRAGIVKLLAQRIEREPLESATVPANGAGGRSACQASVL